MRDKRKILLERFELRIAGFGSDTFTSWATTADEERLTSGVINIMDGPMTDFNFQQCCSQKNCKFHLIMDYNTHKRKSKKIMTKRLELPRFERHDPKACCR